MSEEKNDPRKKLTVSEEAMGELKAGTLTCAPLYNKNVGPTLTRNASLALRAIRGVNAPRPVMSTGLPTTGGRYIIEGDQTS